MGFKSTGAICQPDVQDGYSSVRRAGPAMGRCVLFLLACMMVTACGKPPTLLEQIRKQNELVVLTRNSPTTYYEGPDGPTGLEFELVSGFADYLGVELRMVVPPNFNDLLPLVVRGDAHLAAAGLSVTERRMETIRFGPVYQEITPQLVYRSGSVRPKTLADLDGHLEVVAGSSHAEQLQELRGQYPDLAWHESDQESETLLNLVWQQLIEYTIADSNELAINRRFYPELKPAFAISDPQSLAWAFARSDDDSLVNEAKKYFAQIREEGLLNQLIERYYGHISEFDYVGTRRYQAHILKRLPQYQAMFQSAAEAVGMDWRLLAAIGYQESHWNPDAISPTGVRGIMMLTLAAAKDLEISNRLDPEQSIRGGAEYLSRMIKRLPDNITEPDRTWLGLAAYNVGLGHLRVARALTQIRGGDADKWVDVKETLPLLSEKKWFQQTRYGYARGREPVRYVENIRSYYDILVWYTEKDETTSETPKPLLLDSLAL